MTAEATVQDAAVIPAKAGTHSDALTRRHSRESGNPVSFARYPEYKNSGIAWVGEVPSHWHIDRLKHHARLVTDKAAGRMFPVALENIEGWSGRFVETEGVFQGEGVAFEAADILFGKLRPYLAKVYLTDRAGEAVGDFHVLRCDRGVVPRYAQYQLLQREFIDTVDGSTFGSRMPRASWEFLGAMPFVLPTHDEQSAIAAFLDSETAKIDALIAEQEKLIALLKEKRQALISHAVTRGLDPNAPMKDSGIEWLGQVPAHWAVVRLKLIASVQTGVAKGKDYAGVETRMVPYIRVANVQDGHLNLDDVAEIEVAAAEVGRYELRAGDVLMNEGGDFDKLGRGAIWHGEIQPCIHQNHVFAVRPSGVDSAWLDAVTGSDYAQFYFMSRSKQSTNLASISSTNLMELPVLIPAKEERNNILRAIEAQSRQINNLAGEVERAIAVLKERRSALISAAVTGKIDVRGAGMQQGRTKHAPSRAL